MCSYDSWQVLNINFGGFISTHQTTLSCKKHESYFSMNLLPNATKQGKFSALCVYIQLPIRGSFFLPLSLPFTDFDRRNMQSPLWLCVFLRCLIVKMAATGEHVHALYAEEGNVVTLNNYFVIYKVFNCAFDLKGFMQCINISDQVLSDSTRRNTHWRRWHGLRNVE